MSITHTSAPTRTERPAHTMLDAETTTCTIVGGGPAGAVLALLLARKGIPVVLLEAHADFDRDFRGDTVHPSVMQVLDELGLAERLLQLRHTKLDRFTIQTTSGPVSPVNFKRLKTRFPYITLMPQKNFLEFITAEAQRYPAFKLVMSARVEELIEEGGVVRGVRYQTPQGWHELRALLTVGTDGRFSRVRKLAGIEPIKTSPPMDVAWLKLPRRSDDGEGLIGRIGKGFILVMLDRDDTWQIGYVIPKGSYQQVHSAGIEALHRKIVAVAPELADRVALLQDWKQVSLLSVESSRCPRWFKPGLLLIGDAAHVMSPVGGVGINYAIQDAVVAANVLIEPLQRGQVRERDLRTVQRRREWPTRIIQALQAQVQRRVMSGVLDLSKPLNVPPIVRLLARIPLLRDIPARVMAFGVVPVHARR